MKLYIVRHGETDANASSIVQGWMDTELNEKGLAQAAEAAKNFDAPIDAIYSSDLKRATRTAEEFRTRHPDIPYFEDARLRERSFGDASGTHRDDHNWEQFWSLENEVTIPNAETISAFTNRIIDFMNYLKTMPYTSVLLVAHGGIQNQILAILDPHYTYQPHANASILEVEI